MTRRHVQDAKGRTPTHIYSIYLGVCTS